MTSRPSPSVPPHRLGARAAATEIAAGRLTSEALVRDCLARIDEREPVVKAWASVDPQAALQAAREADRAGGTGVLRGIPIGWKDVIDCQGLPTGCGSPIYQGHQAATDAGAVAMSRRAGAVVLGKTVTTEFAANHPGPTTNPHNPAHTPGGSSSGSAAAVADGMVPLAVGTQTGGSVIRPASFCGVVGFKPSFGLINRYGVKQLADSLDTVGSFARSVADTGLLVGGLTGRAEFLDSAPARPLRVVLCKSADWPEAEAATLEALQQTLRLLSSQGVAVIERPLPAPFAGMQQAHHDIEYFELARALQHEYRCHRSQLSDSIASRIEAGLACPPAQYEAALALRHRCQGLIAEFFGDADLLLAPSAPGEAPPGLGSTGKAVFNRLWTAMGLPCITLPGFRGPGGLPIGVQFIARSRQDARLLAQAAWIEAILPRED
jgi:Asp-tRNA(Asn)/Glu-tRNA(Gln) amidotransferase A subunit family amidase